MRLLASILVAPLMGLVMLSAACGGDDDEPTPTATVAPTPAPVVLNVTTMDNSFSPAAGAARAGQKVTVNVKNDGQRPHSFTIDGVADTGRLDAGHEQDGGVHAECGGVAGVLLHDPFGGGDERDADGIGGSFGGAWWW